MKKQLILSFLCLSLALSPTLKADAPSNSSEPMEEEPVPTTAAPSDQIAPMEEEGTPVGYAASEGANAAKKKQWQNIALAVGAVAVAVTALVLVSSNEGHHAKKHGHE